MNTQKVFSKIYIIIAILGIIALAWFYIIPTWNEMTFQKMRADSYREYVENNPPKEDSKVVDDATSSDGQNSDKATYDTQAEMIAGRTATAEYDSYTESGTVPNSWIKKEIKTSNEKILTFIVPQEYKDIILAEIVNKKIDSKPEGYDLNAIGGSVFDLKEYEIYIAGAKSIVNYTFVTSTNYKWNMYEFDLGNSMHLEIGYTYKTELDDPKIPQGTFDKIIGSIKIE